MVKNKFRLPKTFLPIILLITYCLPLNATVRYVSHDGSNTPPYTTWETAADSIMFAINISGFGDTIYVANGFYEEQVTMIPGLALIGAGMDSCVIDTRELVTSNGFVAVEVKDSCIFKGFLIIVYSNSEMGYGIVGGGSSVITLNRITNAKYGLYCGPNPTVYKNSLDHVGVGIDLFNSNAIIRKNVIYIPPNSSSLAGISIGAFDYSYKPVIDSNYIEVEGFAFTSAHGIDKSFGASPIITNNTIFLRGPQNDGIRLSYSDSGKVFNNLILVESGDDGIYNQGTQYLQVINNYIIGNFGGQGELDYGITVGPDNVVKNNVVINAVHGVSAWGNENLLFQYNNVWNNTSNYSGFTPDSTNLSVDPMTMNDDTTQGELDFHIQMYSQLIDAGDPIILDVDGSRSDIGLYGGPLGESYTYQDLAPKPPRNLTAEVDSNIITLKWNRNTEADFSHYNLYRDTTANFVADSNTFVMELTDTFYLQLIPPGIDAFYYKLTAADSQGNVSGSSEELAVIITSVNEYPTIVSNYHLYQNFPNPFNPSTKIAYKLKERGYVKLMVYDIKGELVSLLVNQVQDAGYYEVEFSGERQEAIGETLAQRLASGIYIYRIMIKSENNIPIFSEMKKMMMIK